MLRIRATGIGPALLLVLFVVLSLRAQSPAAGPDLRVDVNAARHPISPYIYGINDYDDKGVGAQMRIPLVRSGGDAATRYNWKNDIYNAGSDWYFQNFRPATNSNPAILPDGSYFDRLLEKTRKNHGDLMGTIPLVGWMPVDRQRACSFSVAKYGPQEKADPYNADCGNGVKVQADGKKVNIQNDPADVNFSTDVGFQQDWVRHLVARYGRANQGGARIYSLDNEPVWWFGVHRDIHPKPATYDEVRDLGIQYAAAIKAADPSALVAGPVSAGWESYFYSALDMVNGWNTPPDWKYWNNPVDRNAHGGVPFVEWYLQQMRDYELRSGLRLLDYVDVHGYITPPGVAFATDPGDAAMQALRLASTRVLWDPTYQFAGSDINEPVRLVPRMREWVERNYPGTKTAITEYNWGAQGHITGALALADVLGIFGREGLDLATIWGPPQPTEPAAFAFRIYRNYDGIGGAFGETSVQAASADQDKLAVYAAVRSDSALSLVVINKTTGDLSSNLRIDGFTPAGTAQVYRYSAANAGAIVREADVNVSAGGLSTTFPGYTITLLVVPASPSVLPVPKPQIGAVVNAASYTTPIAPGQIVTLFGTGLGPEKLSNLELNASGLVADTVSETRVLFDGIAAPLIYVSAKQASAVVPYAAAWNPAAHVQVEYRGHRSDPFEVAVAASAPAIFSMDMSGSGQGAILNENASINSVLNPAAAGSIVVIYLTGEGQTDLPGVDGRIAGDILAKPLLPVSVEIGGLPASIEYAGAAPQSVAGLMQINARMSRDVPPGPSVAVRVKIGNASSQAGATLAVK